jgi:hypothetical protein
VTDEKSETHEKSDQADEVPVQADDLSRDDDPGHGRGERPQPGILTATALINLFNALMTAIHALGSLIH